MIVSSVPDRPVQTRTTGARAARERERERERERDHSV